MLGQECGDSRPRLSVERSSTLRNWTTAQALWIAQGFSAAKKSPTDGTGLQPRIPNRAQAR